MRRFSWALSVCLACLAVSCSSSANPTAEKSSAPPPPPPAAELARSGLSVVAEADVTLRDDPRKRDLAIDVTWEDQRSGQVLAAQTVPISPDAVALISHASFAPETGQSRATAERKAMDITARQIVDLMETPW